MYHLVTTLTEDGGTRHERRDRFGFREFWTAGDKLILNGTPVNFLATAGHPRGQLDGELSKEGALDFFARIRQAGCVASRYISNLLTNLGCPFGEYSSGVTIAAATMEPQRDFRFSQGNDGAAYLGSNGTIARRVRFAAPGEYELLVQVSGTEAGGELPNVRVGLDDHPIGNLQLEKTGWHTLRLPMPHPLVLPSPA